MTKSKRIYLNNYDDWGCGYYRCQLPALNCYSDLSMSGINLKLQREIEFEEDWFDAYIFHRIPKENSIFFLQKMQQAGKKFILELDDDIMNIPAWMPSEEQKNPKWSFKRAVEMADEIWVSTPSLAEAVNKPNKTYVLPNLIDFNAFKTLDEEPHLAPIHIMWMGSMWHERDLEQIVEPIQRLSDEYGTRLRFIFWGYLPTAFTDYERIPGQNIAVVKQKATCGHKIIFLDGVNFNLYYDRLVKIKPYIGLAPLFDCKFNDSKSNIKYLEYTMAGAATIATNLPPYKDIKNGENGLLVEPGDTEGWYNAIKSLIEDRSLRDTLVKNAKEKSWEEYSWQSQNRKKMWVDAFKRIVR